MSPLKVSMRMTGAKAIPRIERVGDSLSVREANRAGPLEGGLDGGTATRNQAHLGAVNDQLTFEETINVRCRKS